MIKRIAIAFGVIMLLVGILGFIPGVTPAPANDVGHGHLFGVFAVDPLHNWVHILTGIVALIVGFTSEAASRTYFRVFGIIYALVAVLGFIYGDSALLGMMANNIPDAVLHVLIAAVALYLGFARMPARERTAEEHHRPA